MKLPNHITQAPEIFRRYLFYQQSQHWNQQQVLDYQNAKLKEIVTYAGKYVPYYRNLFSEIGLDTSTFRGIEDLQKIPLLDKNTLRNRTQEFVATSVDVLDPQIETTSGSTGTPLVLSIDKHSRANKYAAYIRAYRWSGSYSGATRFVIKGFSESKNKPYGYDLLRNMVYLNCSRINNENCLGVYRILITHKPVIFEGYARSFVDFYNIVSAEGLKLPSPKGIFAYGETVTQGVRSFLETSYQTKLFDFYSHAENAAMICEMPDNKRYLMEDYFFPEIVDSEGKPAADGYGELVGTSFYNYAMPFIRYKTRDMVRLGDDQSKAVAFRQVEAIEGRMDDCILLPDGRKIYFAEGAVGYAKGVIAAQYIQDQPGHLTINLIVDETFNEDQYPMIEKGLVKRIGDSLKINFQIVDELEKKQSGKVPFIINRIIAEYYD